MNSAIENLKSAQQFAMSTRPKVGGFPYLAETLRQAGVTKNIWTLPSCQSLYITNEGPVVIQGTPLTTGYSTIAPFDRDALMKAIRKDQAGESSFVEFLNAAWNSGVVSYKVDFMERKVIYLGLHDESYVEEYPEAEVKR